MELFLQLFFFKGYQIKKKIFMRLYYIITLTYTTHIQKIQFVSLLDQILQKKEDIL